MKKELTEIVFIIDRSGSMCGLEDDTIGGFNSFIEKQKQEEGQARISTILFDDKIEILHDREDINNVKKMTKEQYYVRGCTALLDAVGYALNKTIDIQNKLLDKADKILFIITTDGYENASKEYTYSMINKLINKQKERKWEFLFLGANIDAIGEANKLGIHSSRAAKYYHDSKGVTASYNSVNLFTKKFRFSEELDEKDCSWKEEIIQNMKEER